MPLVRVYPALVCVLCAGVPSVALRGISDRAFCGSLCAPRAPASTLIADNQSVVAPRPTRAVAPLLPSRLLACTGNAGSIDPTPTARTLVAASPRDAPLP